MTEPTPDWRITCHAIARYRQRTGCKKSDETITRRLMNLLPNRKRLDSLRWYACGWVFVVRGNHVLTIMRPKSRRLLRRIWEVSR